LDCA